MSRFSLIFRLACIALFLCAFSCASQAQIQNVTIDHSTTINDAKYANSYVSVIGGANSPTVVSIENNATILELSAGNCIINLRGGEMGSEGGETAALYAGVNSTVNYYYCVLNYGPLNINGTMNLYGDVAIKDSYTVITGEGTINIFSRQSNRIQANNVNILGGADAASVLFTGQATVSDGIVSSLIGSGVATITGGTVGYGDNFSTFTGTMNVFGGVVTPFAQYYGRVTGTINVFGGRADAYLESGGVANFYGGIGSGECSAQSALNFYGGSNFGENDGGTMNIYGGTFSAGLAYDGATNFYGRGLQYDSANNFVTGTLRDGSPIHCNIYRSGNATINLINDQPASVTGSILFSELVVNAPAQNVTFTFRPADGTAPIEQTIAVSAFGAFTVPNLPRQAGVLHIKPDKFLAANISVDLSGGNVSGAYAEVQPGDANNDNSVDSTDFGILIGAFNTSASIPDSGYDVTADFNGDGSVDSSDFGILIGNFNRQGAQ